MNKLIKIWQLFDFNEKKKFLFIIFFSLIYVFFEALSISLVIPIVALLMNPDFVNNDYLVKLINFFDLNQFIISSNAIQILCIILTCIFVIKNIYIYLYYLFIYKFIENLQTNISKKILNKYLHQSYNFFITRKSSSLIATINDESNNISQFIALPFIYLISEGLLIGGIILLIIIFDFIKVGIVLSVFMVVAIFLLKSISAYLRKIGKKRQEATKIKILNINKLILNIREIILSGKKNFYFNSYSKSIGEIAETRIKNRTFDILPRLFFEIIAIFSVTTIILYLYFINSPNDQIISSLTFFVLVSLKIIPSLNKFIHSYQNLQYSDSIINLISKEMNLKKSILYFSNKLKFNKLVSFQNVNFNYPQRNTYVFKNLNFNIKKNTTIGIVGMSGVGKSTFIDLLSGLLKPTKGFIKVDNKILKNMKLVRSWQNNISYVSQNINLFDDTIKNNICLPSNKSIDEKKLLSVVANLDLKDAIENLPEKYETTLNETAKNLSGGQIQRLGLARALYEDGNILILDEATNALDNITDNKIINVIKKLKKKKTIIIISHKKNILNICDQIFTIKNSKLIKC